MPDLPQAGRTSITELDAPDWRDSGAHHRIAMFGGGELLEPAQTVPATGRWMPGVFRQLRHYVRADDRMIDAPVGVTYYARCGSPCLWAPHGYAWSDWSICPDCAPSPRHTLS